MEKIAFFTPSLKIGGIERVFLTYAECLINKGYDVFYVTCNNEIEMGSILPEINIVTVGNTRLRKSLFSIARYFRKNDFDIIITGGDIPNLILILIFKLYKIKSKLIISHHNYFNIERSTLLSKIIIRRFYNFASHTIAVSEGIKNLLLDEGMKNDKIHIIYNPININKIMNEGDTETDIILPQKYIVFAGRLGKVKNLFLLIDSFNILQQRLQSLELLIIGDGPMRKLLKEKVIKSNMNGKIHFLGTQGNPFPIFKQALAIILTSFSEALPTTILEGFVFGKTVVSTPTIGAMDLLENGNLGYISDTFDNAADFANLIEKAILFPISKELLKTKINDFSGNHKTDELIRLFYI